MVNIALKLDEPQSVIFVPQVIDVIMLTNYQKSAKQDSIKTQQGKDFANRASMVNIALKLDEPQSVIFVPQVIDVIMLTNYQKSAKQDSIKTQQGKDFANRASMVNIALKLDEPQSVIFVPQVIDVIMLTNYQKSAKQDSIKTQQGKDFANRAKLDSTIFKLDAPHVKIKNTGFKLPPKTDVKYKRLSLDDHRMVNYMKLN